MAVMVVATIVAVSADGTCAMVAIMVMAVADIMKRKLPAKISVKMFVRRPEKPLERTKHRIVAVGRTLHFPLFRC